MFTGESFLNVDFKDLINLCQWYPKSNSILAVAEDNINEHKGIKILRF